MSGGVQGHDKLFYMFWCVYRIFTDAVGKSLEVVPCGLCSQMGGLIIYI